MINRNWTWLLALASGVAIGAVLAQRRHTRHQLADRQQHKSDVRDWENEGGNLAPARARS